MHALQVQLRAQLRVAFHRVEHEEKTPAHPEGAQSSCRRLALVLAQTAWPAGNIKSHSCTGCCPRAQQACISDTFLILIDHSSRTATTQTPASHPAHV